jgi:arginase
MSRLENGLTVLGAPSSIGIRPYDLGGVRQLHRAPDVLRQRGLTRRIEAGDAGDVKPPPYRDFVRPPRGVRNEPELADYSREIAQRIQREAKTGRFLVLLGGDCSILLGALFGFRQLLQAPIGLAYVDGHCDFATPDESLTGSGASMDLAMAIGRGNTPLARLDGDQPLVRATDVVLVGRRDEEETYYSHDALRGSGILDIPYQEVRARGLAFASEASLARVTRDGLSGFWIHLDSDVLDSGVMPAVDSPLPNGPDIDDVVELVSPLVRHPLALGLQLTIYDPALDPDGRCADRLVDLLGRLLASDSVPAIQASSPSTEAV